MNTTIDLTAVPLWLTVAVLLVLFLAAVGASVLVYGLIIGFRSMPTAREAPVPAEPAAPLMKVVAPWSDAGASDVLAGDVLWRHQIEAEAAPVFASTPLPDHESVWRQFPKWNLDDPNHTQAWPIIRGYDADDLDPGPEPQVDPGSQRRFVRSDAEMPALAAAQGFESPGERFIKDPVLAEAKRLLPQSRRAKRATVDLEAGTVVVSQ